MILRKLTWLRNANAAITCLRNNKKCIFGNVKGNQLDPGNTEFMETIIYPILARFQVVNIC